MSQLSDHFGYDTANYGRKLALGLAIGVHALLLVVGGYLAYASPDKEQQIMTAHRIRLGGPKNMDMGAKTHKAPVVGKVKKPRPKPKTKPKPTVKTPPKATKDQVGLKKTPTKKQPKPTENSTDDVSKQGKQKPAPNVPDDKDMDKSARAVGGLGGDEGVALEIGDGSKDVNLEDLEFINFFKMVRARLSTRWSSRGLSGGATTIRFHIGRDGSVGDVTISKSSGLGYLDGPAKRAVMGVELPPLPQSYVGEELILNIVFNYDRK